MLVDPSMFWVMVLIVYFAGQIPILSKPFRLLSTWVHELGHGLGAIISGGSFEQMIITPRFSGLAHTFSGGDLERVVVLLSGLLGPAIAGGLMLILTRRFGRSRPALLILAAALFATLILWAGDNFTRISVLGFGIVVSLIAVKASPLIRSASAHVIALAFCLNAVADFSYFFMNSSNLEINGGKSDTTALADIIGGPHIFWAIVPSLLSILILFMALKLSGGFGKNPPR